jgi:hypothetical protein
MQLKNILEANVKTLNTKTKPNVNNVTGNQVHAIAQKLADRFNDYGSYNYFLKVAWKIPEHDIMINLEASMKGRSPVRLFTYLCNKSMAQ